MTDPKNAWLASVQPGISNGVLGYLGVQPSQYDQAQALIAAGLPSLNNADRLSGYTSTDIANQQALAGAGGTFLNGQTITPSAGAGYGGIQSDPRNESLWAQSAAQMAAQQQPTQSPNPLQGTPPSPSGQPSLGGSVGSGGIGGGLVQNVNLSQYQQNPYLSQMGDVLTNRVTQNLNRNIMPGIRSSAIAAGGFGGSRQGVIEANALNDANRQISDSLTGAYFQDFTNSMNRNLAQYGQNQSFYNANRGMDLQQAQLGANLWQMGNQGFLGQGSGLYNLGQTQQQAPWQTVNNANAGLGQWSGYGTTTSANQGGGAQGLLGGALAGGQMGRLWGNTGSQLGQVSNREIEQSWGLTG